MYIKKIIIIIYNMNNNIHMDIIHMYNITSLIIKIKFIMATKIDFNYLFQLIFNISKLYKLNYREIIF
jgi:hypothetical protein